jgi:ABC-type transporter Mla subunit MlaD
MSTQGERGDRICDSLEQLAKAMSDHPTTSRQQSEMLKTIAAQIETANSRNQRLVEAVSKIPELSQTQNESLNRLNSQLEMVNEQNVTAHRAMDRVGGTLQSLGEANSSQAAALREMNEKTNQQNALMTKLIAAQSRRFTMLFVVTLILAVTAVVATVLKG